MNSVLRGVALMVALVLTMPAWAQSGSTLFLPAVLSNSAPPGLYGQLRDGSNPAGGLAVGLARYTLGNPPAPTYVMTTTTASDGSFAFPGLPALGANQAYFVRWVNTSDTFNGRAFVVFSGDVIGFDGASTIRLNPLDISNIGLISPGASSSAVGLPITFNWGIRLSSFSTDRYQHRLFNSDLSQLVALSPNLGTVGTYTLAALPSGVHANTDYYWDVTATGSDGYEVIGWEVRLIRFAPGLATQVVDQAGAAGRPVPQSPGRVAANGVQ